MKTMWHEVSTKLYKEVDRAYALFEGLLNGEKNSVLEKEHWWKFLSVMSNVPIEQLKVQAKVIFEKDVDQNHKEDLYCELLGIKKPLNHHVIEVPMGKELSKAFTKHSLRNIPTEYDTKAWIFRWIYTFTDDNNKPQKEPGIARDTLKTEDKTTINQVFKRAAFISKGIKNGTPDKWSGERIAVKRDELTTW